MTELQGKCPIAPSREGKRSLTVWLERSVIKQLKLIALETDRSQEALMREALNQLFRQHGKPEIA